MAELKLGTTIGGSVAWHEGNDGSGSGLDADLWDGYQFADYLNQAVKTNSSPTFAKITTTGLYGTAINNDNNFIWQYNSGNPGYGISYFEATNDYLKIDVSGNLVTGTPDFQVSPDAAYINGNAVWHAGNDGASSGLDADLLDGNHASAFALASHTHSYLPLTGGDLSNGDSVTLEMRPNDAGQAYLKVGRSLNGSQGTGIIEVTQDGAHGGGFYYNGDGSPQFISGESADTITFYRMNGGSKFRVFQYGYSSDTVDFVATPTVGGTAVSLSNHGHTSFSAPLNIDGGTANGANDATLYVTATNNNDWGLIVNKYNGSASEYGVEIRVGSSASYGLRVTGNGAEVFRVSGSGALTATSKSFLIPHPTKEGWKLRYGSLEGPENGVYVRGKLKGENVIELPEYWTKLVDPDSITVQLTAIGKHQKLYVEDIRDNKVYIVNDGLFAGEINCFYYVQGERVDVEKLVVEYE